MRLGRYSLPLLSIAAAVTAAFLSTSGIAAADTQQADNWAKVHGAAVSSSTGDALANGRTIRSDLNGKCLDIKGGSFANGAPVIMFDCHGGANQRWSQVVGRTIRSDLNGKCLDIKGGSFANGAPIIMFDCHGGANQRWSWV